MTNTAFCQRVKNLLSNQEALAKQITKSFESNVVLFSKGKANPKNILGGKNKEEDLSEEKGGNSQSKKPITCFKCGKIGHITKNCEMKLDKATVPCIISEEGDPIKWEHCFTAESIEQKSTQAFINYDDNMKGEWIIDYGCSTM